MHSTFRLNSANSDAPPFGNFLSRMCGKFTEFRRNHRFIIMVNPRSPWISPWIPTLIYPDNPLSEMACFPKIPPQHPSAPSATSWLSWKWYARILHAEDRSVFHLKIKKILIEYSDHEPNSRNNQESTRKLKKSHEIHIYIPSLIPRHLDMRQRLHAGIFS